MVKKCIVFSDGVHQATHFDNLGIDIYEISWRKRKCDEFY